MRTHLLLILALCCATPSLARADDAFERAASPDPEVRIAATGTLADDGGPRATSLLVTMLQRDVDPSVRRAAAVALGTTRQPSLAPALEAASETDPDPGVRRAAARAYERLWPHGKRPGTAAGLSLLCPGCGHVYLRRPGRGLAQLGATAALLGGGFVLLSDGDDLGLGGPAADRDDPIGLQLVTAGQNLWFYSVYAAYRDARLLREDEGYRYPVAREGLADLASAPFRPSVVKSPWVWGAVPLAVGAGLGLSYLLAPDDFEGGRTLLDGGEVDFLGHGFGTGPGFALGEMYYAGLFTPVAVGEEALFRGVLQSALSEKLGAHGGWAVASTAFGLVHILNFFQPGAEPRDALFAVPFITAVGSGLGLAYMEDDYQLSKPVAMHFWYDFLLGTASFIANPDDQPFVVRSGFVF